MRQEAIHHSINFCIQHFNFAAGFIFLPSVRVGGDRDGGRGRAVAVRGRRVAGSRRPPATRKLRGAKHVRADSGLRKLLDGNKVINTLSSEYGRLS